MVDRFEPARLVVEIAQIVLHEGNEPNVLADLRDADLLPGKDVTEIDLLALEADPTAPGYQDRLVVKRGTSGPRGCGLRRPMDSFR